MRYAIANVTVIDMISPDATPDSTVIVTDNRITAVGPSDAISVPERAKVVDGSGQYMMPGLWDTHVHASRDLGIEYMPLLLATGVTGVRDMAGDFAVTKRFREEIYPRVREFIWRRELSLSGVAIEAALPKKTEAA